MKKMKIVHAWAWKSIVFLVAVLLTPKSMAQVPDTAKISELLTWLENRNEAMGSIAISKNGKMLYRRAIGYRYIGDKDTTVANVNTKYRIWSITKTYTATMILQLIEEGKLNLETTLDSFLPGIANAKIITIREMLSHRSGIHDFTDPGPDTTGLPKGDTKKDMIKKIARFKSDFNPGDKFQYSNSNFLLLGYIIEKLDGNSYGTSLRKRISSKVGLFDTYFGLNPQDKVDNKSLSYQFQNGKWADVPEGDFSSRMPGGAGSIVSTPTDMVKFIEALFSGKLISKSSLSLMTDIKEFYGLGIFSRPYHNFSGLGHTGGYLASYSSLMYYPGDSLAVAYCTNGQVLPMETILNFVLNIYHNPSYVLPFKKAELVLTTEILKRYEGTYEFPGLSISIKQEGGYLIAQPAGQLKSVLYPSRENYFFLKDMDIEIEFDIDATGNVDKLYIINVNGEKKMAKKVTEAK